ncbi:MAG: hypothetical protein ACRDGF_08250, partial [Chloroflexota bacterium]
MRGHSSTGQAPQTGQISLKAHCAIVHGAAYERADAERAAVVASGPLLLERRHFGFGVADLGQDLGRVLA